MKAICVDDEQLAVEYTLQQLSRLPEIGETEGFTEPRSALDWLREHSADIAILDIDMPEIDGITLAARIKEICPEMAIIFLTAYRDYALDAYSVHPIGYLLKPVSQEKLAAEVHYACERIHPISHAHIQVRTFGSFDVYVDDAPIHFELAKAKEILAYLIDRQGVGVTRAEVFAAIWGDRLYDRKMQKQFDVYLRSLCKTLRENGISEIMKMERGTLRVDPNTFTCDSYFFFSGDSDTINAYRGEYMTSYSWANITESLMYWRVVERHESH